MYFVGRFRRGGSRDRHLSRFFREALTKPIALTKSELANRFN
jgi:hypothetical protein